jgi:lysophospholipase L1-like esterase
MDGVHHDSGAPARSSRAWDGSHPNAEGYRIIARNLLAVIEPYPKKDVQIRP